MIPFRYLVISLTVVILALAAGILLGGTVIDPALQTRLSEQVRNLSRQIDQERRGVRIIEIEHHGLRLGNKTAEKNAQLVKRFMVE